MMISRRYFLSCLLAGGVSAHALNATQALPTVLDTVYFHNYPPFSWDDGVRMRGILIDVLDHALEERLRIPASHTGYPWKRAQHLVRINAADAFCTVPTPERLKYTVASKEPVLVATFTIFINRNSDRRQDLSGIETLDDLHGFRLGHYLGSGWAAKNLKGRGFELFEAATLDSALAMLAANRIDAIIDTSQVIRYRILQLELDDTLMELPQVLDKAPFSLCIGKQSPFAGIIPSFDNAMRQMR